MPQHALLVWAWALDKVATEPEFAEEQEAVGR
jgi:hypothetical protein